MTAYFAILKDSFREAIASRVLLISLAGLIVVLLLLAPFRLQYNQSISLRRSEVTDPARLLTDLTTDNKNKPEERNHLWNILSEDEKSGFTDLLPDEDAKPSAERGRRGNSRKRRLVERLNQLLKKENFYDELAWADVRQSDELKKLIETTDLSPKQSQRRNLLLFATTFRRSITITDSSAIYLMYGSAEVFGPIPLTPTEFEPRFREVTVAVVAVFLGFFGVFGTLLITAGIIPRTFEPGEITLLASKPIRRSGLFLTKFLGGCIFTLLFAIVLVVGVWLILGFRMESWNARLLWCIPIYVFLFMIYYSVSAVSGVIWKNPIVSLTVVVLFWLVITVVGATRENLTQSLVNDRGIKEILIAGDDLLTVDGQKQTWLWNSETESWEEVFAPSANRINDFIRRFRSSNQIRFAPVYDAEQDRIVAIQANQSPFGGMASPELIVGSPDDDWDRRSLGRIPSVTSVILPTADGRMLLISQEKILSFDDRPDQKDSEPTGGGLLDALMGGTAKGFQELQPKGFSKLSENFAACLIPNSDTLLIYSDGQLQRLEFAEGKYKQVQTAKVDPNLAATVASTDKAGILCFRDGTAVSFSPNDLIIRNTFGSGSGIVPKHSVAASDGQHIAVLTHDETVMIFDGQTGKLKDWAPPENGSCSAISFNNDGELLVSDGRLAVHCYELSNGERRSSWAQRETGVYGFYDHIVTPLWTVLPWPGQLDRFAKWALDGDEEVLANEAQGPPEPDASESLLVERERFSPSQVLLKNGLFIVILLAFGCFYVQRSDF